MGTQKRRLTPQYAPTERKTFSGLRRHLLTTAAVGAMVSLLMVGGARANPTGPTAQGATATGAGTSNPTVQRSGSRAIIDWNTFNIANGDTTTFLFNSNSGIALNRVNTGSATINGNLLGCVAGPCTGSNFGGNIWIYARDGVFIGNGAVVNTGGFLATTAPMSTSDSDFLGSTESPANQFAFGAANAGSSVQVQGNASITGHGGTLAFIAPTVSTDAGTTITAPNGSGSVLFGAATSYTVKFAEDASTGDMDLVNFDVPAGSAGGSTSTTPITIKGATKAGSIYVAAVTQSSVANAMISIAGTQTATQATSVGGDIVLSAGGGIENGQAAAPSGGAGGTVGATVAGSVQADTQVSLNATGSIDASAAAITGSTTNASTTLSGSSSGGADISNSGNLINNVSGFSNASSGDVKITSGTALSVSGTLGNTGGNLALTDSDGIAFNGGSASTSGNQTYSGPVALGADTTLTSTGGGAIDFGSTVGGAFNLAVSGNAEFDSSVGGTTALAGLSVSGTTEFGNPFVNSINVQTAGNQTYTGAVTLASGASNAYTLASTGGLIDFKSTVDGNYAGEETLAITGNAEFDGNVGGGQALGSLSVSGTTAFGVPFGSSASVTTLNNGLASGNQTYTGAVTLNSDTSLASTGGTVQFNGTVDSVGTYGPGFAGLTVTG